MHDVESVMAEIASKGLAKAEELEASAARMRANLADATFLRARAEAQLRAEQEKFDWEREEHFAPNALRTADGA